MSESARMWMEISFNIAYLIVIYELVIAMWRRLPQTDAGKRPLLRLFILAFGLLALGDTGHVGFRVWAYAQGTLDSQITLLGRELGLVGLGALATAFTVTLFYVVMLGVWQERFQKPYGWLGLFLAGTAVIRLIIMVFPANEWNNSVPPQPWSLYRNLPLIVQGLGVAYLILRDARQTNDRTFSGVGIYILLSYAFYLPVILLVQQYPLVGMLMIPKTLAYVAIAWLGYREFATPVFTATQKPQKAVFPGR